MPGTATHDSPLGAVLKELWLSKPGDTGISLATVYGYLDQIYSRLTAGCGNSNYYLSDGSPFKGLTIETWNISRPDCGEIRNYGGLTYPDQNLIQVAHTSALPYIYGHEFGHRVEQVATRQRSDRVGAELWNLYCGIRGQDFTAWAGQYERWAWDFNFFYGPDGVAGTYRPDDDAPRKAHDVLHLGMFIKGFFPVSFWLRLVQWERLEWRGFYFQWLRDNRWWESYSNGNFSWWDGQKWRTYGT